MKECEKHANFFAWNRVQIPGKIQFTNKQRFNFKQWRRHKTTCMILNKKKRQHPMKNKNLPFPIPVVSNSMLVHLNLCQVPTPRFQFLVTFIHVSIMWLLVETIHRIGFMLVNKTPSFPTPRKMLTVPRMYSLRIFNIKSSNRSFLLFCIIISEWVSLVVMFVFDTLRIEYALVWYSFPSNYDCKSRNACKQLLYAISLSSVLSFSYTPFKLAILHIFPIHSWRASCCRRILCTLVFWEICNFRSCQVPYIGAISSIPLSFKTRFEFKPCWIDHKAMCLKPDFGLSFC